MRRTCSNCIIQIYICIIVSFLLVVASGILTGVCAFFPFFSFLYSSATTIVSFIHLFFHHAGSSSPIPSLLVTAICSFFFYLISNFSLYILLIYSFFFSPLPPLVICHLQVLYVVLRTNPVTTSIIPTVILVSLDGFRYDYLDLYRAYPLCILAPSSILLSFLLSLFFFYLQ